MLGMFDTMKYLARGGRVNRAIANIGDFLSIKPLLTFRDGEIVRAGMVRTFSQGMNRLYDFAAARKEIRDMMIAHSAIPDAAEQFRKRLGALFPEERIIITRLGAALGTHGGPGVILVAVTSGE
jgi:DegV family protein with EDD domain